MVKPCFDLFLQVMDEAVAAHVIPPPLQVFPAARTLVCAGSAKGPASPEQASIFVLPRVLKVSQPPVGSPILHLVEGGGFNLPFLIPQTTKPRAPVPQRQ